MARISYTKYKPKGPAARIVELANDILRDYNRQGFNLTVRQLYYQFVSRDLFPDEWVNEIGTKNHTGNYNRLKSIIAKAREGGLVDWEYIKDRGRSLTQRPHWVSGQQFLNSVAPQFHIDLWLDQPKRVEVWVEKDALSDVIDQACNPLDVPNFACKGYASASSMWEAAHNRFLLKYAQAEQDIVIIHLGDHDPSGVHMTQDIEERLKLFASPYEDDQKRANITVQRIALTMAQVEEYEPPPNPTKEADPRSAVYRREFGETCWELDALEPRMLVRLVREAIEEHLDRRLFDARKEYADGERHRLIAMANHWDAMVEALPPGAIDEVAEAEEPDEDEDLDEEEDE
jgi:hypothetical protein